QPGMQRVGPPGPARSTPTRPRSPAAVAGQHAVHGNPIACPLCIAHGSALLNPRLGRGVDTGDDPFKKPSHGCHYSPETVSPKYKLRRWRRELADPDRVQTFAPT